MNDDPTSLERLHDLALPSDVSWWPLAAGWYVVFALLLLVAIRFLWHARVKWKANAYRREALVQLAGASDVAAVAEILRRAALVFSPRNSIADLSGEAWVNWLSDRCAEPMPQDVREQLVKGLYQRRAGGSDATHSLAVLKDYASHWIQEHTASSMVNKQIKSVP